MYIFLGYLHRNDTQEYSESRETIAAAQEMQEATIVDCCTFSKLLHLHTFTVSCIFKSIMMFFLYF